MASQHSIFMKTKVPLLVLLLISTLGLGLRTFHLERNPVSLYWDEAAMAYDAFSVATTGKDMHGNPWWQAMYPSYGDYKLPMYIWLAAGLMKLFGPEIWVFRLVSALFGVGLVISVYFLGEKLFQSAKVGILAALMVAMSPWAIQFSRAGFEANLGVFFLSVSLLCLVRFIRQPQFILAAALFGALAVYSYFSVRFVFPILVLSYLIIFWRLFIFTADTTDSNVTLLLSQ
jgi:4-amino-4-deoxy-L-arabinose transferase-like glycosyltransferase